MSFYHVPFLNGLGIGFALIVAIGAQNAYVLRQGILQNHHFAIALTCALIDACLIFAGVGGFGLILTSYKTLFLIARFGGAAFLIYYGIKSLLSVYKISSLNIDLKSKRTDFSTAILTALALSLLNPHVYLDTCIFIGTIGSQFPKDERIFFTIGAITASFVWFFSLSYGAKYLIPLFQKPISWKILDFLIAVMMFTIAGFLLFGVGAL